MPRRGFANGFVDGRRWRDEGSRFAGYVVDALEGKCGKRVFRRRAGGVRVLDLKYLTRLSTIGDGCWPRFAA